MKDEQFARATSVEARYHRWNGAAAGFFGALGLIAALLAYCGPSYKDARNWLFEWQTLVGSVIALGGGLTAYLGILSQLAQQDRIRSELRFRRGSAARAAIPEAANTIYQYWRDQVAILAALGPTTVGGRITMPQGWQPPLLPHWPADAFTVIRSCIEHESEKNMEALGQLFAQAQITRARTEEFLSSIAPSSSEIVTTSHYRTRIYELLEIQVRFGRLFSYGRQITEEISTGVSLSDMTNQAQIDKIPDNVCTDFAEDMRKRYLP